jgi:hypothetical protein
VGGFLHFFWLKTSKELIMKAVLDGKATLIFAILLTVALAGNPVLAATKVFLLGGQSNMAGVGGYTGYNIGSTPWGDAPGNVADAACPAIYANQTNVNFWNYDTNTLTQVYAQQPYTSQFPNLFVQQPGVGSGWTSLKNGFGYMPFEFGPELSFGYRLKQLYPNDDIYLVKLGITSTSLAGDWNPTSGAVYNLFKQRVTNAINNLKADQKTPEIAGMVWMQGEQDATDGGAASAYAANLKNFITTVRSTFNAPNMKFVAGRITTDVAQWAGTGQTSQVRNALWNVGNTAAWYKYGVANASCVNTDDLEKAYYEHYGTQGQIDLGIRFANEFTPAPEPSTLVMVGAGAICVLGYLTRKRK